MLLNSNWESKIQQLRHNIEFWDTLPLSLVGRINALKMVTLPKFQYMFKCLPAYIPLYHFKQLNAIISSFMWNNKIARISKRHLCKDKLSGGFGLPYFQLYFWAANLRVLSLWRKSPTVDPTLISEPSWLRIKQAACGRTSLPALLNNPAKARLPSYIANPVILNTLRMWRKIQSFLNLPKVFLDSPICKNHAFIPGLDDPIFSIWKDKNIVKIGDLYTKGKLASFQQLQQSHYIPSSLFFLDISK